MLQIPCKPKVDPAYCFIKGKLYIKCGSSWASLKIPDGIFLDVNYHPGLIVLSPWDGSWRIMMEAGQISSKEKLWTDIVSDIWDESPTILYPSAPIVYADCEGEEMIWGGNKETYHEVRIFTTKEGNTLNFCFYFPAPHEDERFKKLRDKVFIPVLNSFALEPEQEVYRYAKQFIE